MKLKKNNTTLKTSIIISMVAHAGLLILFLVIHIGLEGLPLPAAEVSFISTNPGSLSGGAITTASRTDPEKPFGAAVQKPAAAIKTTPDLKQPRPPAAERKNPVSLPSRRMIEKEEAELATARDQDKITPNMNDDPSAQSQPSTAAGTGSSIDRTVNEGKTGDGSGKNGEGGSPFTIEGEAAQRIILSQILPAYPEGLQREAVIKLRFTLQPDGRLQNILPMRKGDPTLERLTIDALQKWRFNPLPANAEQKSVDGMITFRYELH